MNDQLTANVCPGDGQQYYATIDLAGVRVTAYRALDSETQPTGRLVIDVDAPDDLGDEVAIYLNDYRLALHEARHPAAKDLAAAVLDLLTHTPDTVRLPGRDDGVRRRNRAVLVHTVPNGVEVTRWHIHGDDLHITPTRARTYRTAAAAARWARAHLLA